MNKRNKIDRKKQRGVALLFALGVLALLLVLGLASVTNALLAQKVANNNSSRSQAKMLAQSAISRVAIALRYYQYDMGQKFVPPSNYLSVQSRYNLSTGTEARTDGLRGFQHSKLIPPNWQDYTEIKEKLNNNEDWATGEWSYVTTGSGSDAKIVGRMAYQLLPSSSTQINLDHVLRGIYSQGTPARVPWDARWGEGINELNLNETTVLGGWATIESGSPPNEATLAVSTFDAFFSAFSSLVDTDAKKKWMRRWFSEGTVAADPEYYRYHQSTGVNHYFHRFYLGDSIPWYDRLKVDSAGTWSAVDANSVNAINALAGDSEEFKITDADTPDGVGLPFLKYIADDPGSFASLKDRRMQIVANFNDYCDSDSDPIPTSNIPATKWTANLNTTNIDSEDPDTGWPKYTGNEKTPYINEFALMFDAVPEIVNPNTSNMQIKLTITPTVLAELIDIYELKPSDSYKLFLNLKKIEFTVDIMGKGDYSITGPPPSTGSFDPGAKPKIFTFIPTAPIEIDFGTGSWKSDGYAVGGATLTAVSQVLDASELGLSALTGITSITDVKVSFEVKDISFEVKGIVLNKSASGVDFVKWNESVTLPASPKKFLFAAKAGPTGVLSLANSNDSFGLAVQEQRFFIAGMQARDPRQNLNISTTPAKNDWSDLALVNWVEYSPSLATADPAGYDATSPNALLTMKLDLTQAALANLLVKGLVNKDANPSGRSPNGDVEIVSDPAWRADSIISDPDDLTGTKKIGHLSTAYIRNAPMRSPWELGAIHRGAAWETINLKNAMKPGSSSDPISPKEMEQPGTDWLKTGTSYAGGDGGLLEQVKMTDNAYSYGKVNVNMLSGNATINPDYSALDDEIGRALFYNIRKGQQLYDLDNLTTPGGSQITWGSVGDAGTTGVVPASLKNCVTVQQENRAQFLCRRSGNNSLANGFGIVATADYDALPDAQQEELVGKTIDLIKCSATASNMLKFIVVAQTIKDVGDSSPGGISVARLDYDGDANIKTDCKFGVFDLKIDSKVPTSFPEYDKYIYYDEITAEIKMLVTMENNPTTGQTIVRQVEYIE